MHMFFKVESSLNVLSNLCITLQRAAYNFLLKIAVSLYSKVSPTKTNDFSHVILAFYLLFYKSYGATNVIMPTIDGKTKLTFCYLQIIILRD